MEKLTPFSVQLLEDGRHDYPDWKTFCIRAKNNCHLATVGQMDRFHEKDYERIAYLMAAAPDLLAQCERFVAMYIADIDLNLQKQLFIDTKAAIAKAKARLATG